MGKRQHLRLLATNRPKGSARNGQGTSLLGYSVKDYGYRATTDRNLVSGLLVGNAYTGMLDLRPRDEFEIKLGRKQISLVGVGAGEEEEGSMWLQGDVDLVLMEWLAQ